VNLHLNISVQGAYPCAIPTQKDSPLLLTTTTYHNLTMAVLTRFAGRVWNLACSIILTLFFSIPLTILASLTTGLAIFSASVLAFRMITAALAKRIDFWRGNEHQPGPNEAPIHEAVHHLIGGPSLIQTTRPRSARTMSSGSRMQSTNDRGFDPDHDYDYGYQNDLPSDDYDDDIDDDASEASEALYLGSWRRRNSQLAMGCTSPPTSSRPTTPGNNNNAYQYRPRSESNGNGNGRVIPNFSTTSPYGAAGSARFDSSGGTSSNFGPDCNYYPSVVMPPAVPVANVAARRSTTSVGSRRSSRVLIAETFVAGREMGEGAS
jgi:hypothetical protein